MAPSSLTEMCKRACIKNIASLTDVGAFEYFQISDVLVHVRTAEQLRVIEENSPQIRGDDAELWAKFIAKEVPDWKKKNYVPKNPVKWCDVYKRYKREQAEEIKKDEEALRQQMMGLQKAREANVSRVVDMKSLPKIPRDPRMLANNGGVPIAKKGFKKENPSSLVFSGGSKTKITDGKSVLTKAYREAKEISSMAKLSRPTHQLASIGRVTRAPVAMVKEYRNAAQPEGRPITSIKILTRMPNLTNKPQRRTQASTFSNADIGTKSLKEREDRLRALTMGTKRTSSGDAKPTLVDDSSDEDDTAGGLFDESAPSSPPSRAQSVVSSPPAATTTRPIAKPKAQKPKLNLLGLPQNGFKLNPVVYRREKSLSPTTSQPPLLSSPAFKNKATTKVEADSPIRPSSVPARSTVRKPTPQTGPSVDGEKPVYVMKKRKEVDIFNRGPKRPRHA